LTDTRRRAAKTSRELGRKESNREPVIVRAADVKPQTVKWLWSPRIPRGKITILQGDPGCGKTHIALSLATTVTRGARFFDEPAELDRAPENVVYLSSEDGIEDTLQPRLARMGADLERVFFLRGWRFRDANGSDPHPITLKDVQLIEKALDDHFPVGLVVLDPIQAFLGEIDMHRANEVRPLLSALGRIAEGHGCAALVLMHMSKAPAARAMYRGLGSIDFAAAARSILLAGVDPKEPCRRGLVHIKSSLAPVADAVGYALDPAFGFKWTGASNLTAAALTAPEPVDGDRSALDEAVAFLEEVLADGGRSSKEVLLGARQAGVTEPTLRRAKEKLGVKAVRLSDGNKGCGTWGWRLPDAPSHARARESTDDDDLATLQEGGEREDLPQGAQPDHMSALHEDSAAQGVQLSMLSVLPGAANGVHLPQGGKALTGT
jgi:hypothetical protein